LAPKVEFHHQVGVTTRRNWPHFHGRIGGNWLTKRSCMRVGRLGSAGLQGRTRLVLDFFQDQRSVRAALVGHRDIGGIGGRDGAA